MNPPWPTFIVAFCTLATAFLLAGQKWKRDRQLALFNKGLAASPDPPAHPIWSWLTNNFDLFTGVLLPAGMLVRLSRSFHGDWYTVAMTVVFIDIIAMTILFRLLAWVFGQVRRVIDRSIEAQVAGIGTQQKLIDHQGLMAKVQGTMADTDDKLVNIVEKLVSRVKVLEGERKPPRF